MKPDILDDSLVFEKEDEHRSDFLSWSAIILLWLGIIYSWYVGYLFLPSCLSALCFLIFATILTYFKFEEGIVLSFFVIIAGFLNLITFFPIRYLITIGSSSIRFDLILFLIGVLHFYANKSILKFFFKRLLGLELPTERKS